MIRATLALAAVLLALFSGLTIGFVNGDQHHAIRDVDAMNASLEHEFDRGMKAGVAYQEWFCTAPELGSN